MLLTREVNVTVNYKNIKRYLESGYEFEYFINGKGNPSVKRGVVISVKVEDIDKKCGAIIKYKCDYCGEEIEVRFCDYMRHKENVGEVDACKKCGNIKLGDNTFKKYGVRSQLALKEVRDKINNFIKEKYGVDNVFELKEIKDKIKATNLEKYGVENYTQTDEYKKKAKQTCLDKYGYDNVSKSPTIINKIKEVQFEKYGSYYNATDEGKEKYKKYCMDNYGVENLFQSEIIKDKSKETCLVKYGHEYAMQNKDVCNRSTQNSMITRARLDKLPSSRQQEYLHKLYGGLKNYVVDNCALDIAIIEDMIDIEFDGSGHNLRVQMGDYTQEEFDRKEMSRKYYLKSKGWNDFRIISLKDKLPNDEVLLGMLYIAKDWIGQGHSWIKFDIDNNIYKTSEDIYDFDYGNLRKITDEDLI